MYKILKIGGVDYKLEYTVEASLYEECIEKLMNFVGNAYEGINNDEMKELSGEELREARRNVMKERISSVSNIPSVAMTVFYAGLLENHGMGLHGDKTIRNKEDAKELVRQYFDEHKDDGTDNFYDILLICMEQMGEDDFFKRTGLEKMTENVQTSKGNRAQRRAAEKASAKQS